MCTLSSLSSLCHRALVQPLVEAPAECSSRYTAEYSGRSAWPSALHVRGFVQPALVEECAEPRERHLPIVLEPRPMLPSTKCVARHKTFTLGTHWLKG